MWDTSLFDNPDPLSRRRSADMVAKADSLAELAEIMGVEVESFIETVGRYNDNAKDGVDLEFGKPAPLFPLIKRPFYAVKLAILRHTQPGGIRVNTKAQVLAAADLFTDEAADNGLPVVAGGHPRLYAAGECAGFLGWRRTWQAGTVRDLRPDRQPERCRRSAAVETDRFAIALAGSLRLPAFIP